MSAPRPADLSRDLIVTSARFVRHVRRHAPAGESTATWRALAILDEHAPMRLTDFADIDQLTQPAATAMIRRLVDEGAVTREPDPTDGRASLLTLTEAGRSRLAEQRAAGAAVVDPALDRLTDRERDRLAEAVRIMTALMHHPTTHGKGTTHDA